MNPFNPDTLFFLDGATGTMLQKKGMKPGQIPELLNLENPQMLRDIHAEYIAAGSQLVMANTFGANAHKLKDTGHTVEEVITAGIAIAKETAAGKDVLVALDLGPIGEMLEPLGSLSFEEAYELYAQMVKAGVQAGADVIAIETMTDLYETKAALLAAKENSDLPVMVTMSFEADGRTFMGTTLESMACTLEGLGADAIGLNCSVGPDKLAPLLARLVKMVDIPVIAKPNAGLPDPVDGHYDMDAASFTESMEVCRQAGVKIFGGCCGTTPEYIQSLTEAFAGKKPAQVEKERVCRVCTPTKAVSIDGFTAIGERINPTGKKRFQKALLEQDFDYIVSVGLAQQEAGADMLDVNVGYPGVNEEEMLPAVVRHLQAVIDLPLQLDSSSPEALEAALRIYNGKPSVNSVNGKQEVLDSILPLISKYGAAVVGLTIDEDGIPQTAAKRVKIARKILEACAQHGISGENLWIDPLALTVSAQQEQAKETLRAIEQIRRDLGLHTVLGVSNISFGLPNRPLITAIFLAQAMQAGLDLGIVNVNQKEIMDALAAARVLKGYDEQSVDYIERFAHEAPVPASAPSASGHTLSEAVIRGLRQEAGLLAKEELKTRSELDLVESVLIPALDQVGSAYEAGRMFLPQLLSAAQAAQSVFEVIRDSLAEKGQESVEKGTIVMATVKGDIHDIGKNIVKTVLENYGYKIIDLGKDVDPQRIRDTVLEQDIALVGLSALMTTTLPAMEETVRLLKSLDRPPAIMVGGAVVTQDFADSIGADYYCKDANDSVKAAREVFYA